MSRFRFWPPRLRSVLLVVNLTVMLLPLGSISFLRLYENEIVRQKEAALYSQAAYVVALYQRELVHRLGDATNDYGHPIAAQWRNPGNPAFAYTPSVPSLSIADSWIRGPHGRRPHFDLDPTRVSHVAGYAVAPVILSAQTANLDGVRIVDNAATVVMSTFNDEGRRLGMWEEVQRALQGEYVATMRYKTLQKGAKSPLDAFVLGADVQVFVALPVTERDLVVGAVVLSGTPSRITEFLYGNSGQLLSALALLMLVVTLISVFSSLTISEPIQSVIKQTALVALGDPRATRPIRFPILHEVKMMSDAIARMATVIQERAGYITSFARSVSHLFKTPLTAIHGTVELLLDDEGEMSAAERRKFLGNLKNDASRLENLVTGLMDLARADVAGPQAQAIDVAPVLARAVSRALAGGAKVTVAAADPAARLPMAPDLLESIIGNLIANVGSHCPPGTACVVTLRARGPQVVLEVKDDGPGISSANQAKVFTPFFTTARGRGGTGLGLSIVRAIARAHGGNVELSSELGKGTTVTVTL